MADDSATATFGKVLLGAAIGFGLGYYLVGFGLGGKGRNEGAGQGPSVPQPPAPPAPPQAKDVVALSFLMVEPTVVGKPSRFRLTGDTKKLYSLDDLIARVKDGGRSDVQLRTAGNVIEGPLIAAREQIERAGIKLSWIENISGSVNVGRGYYRRGLA